MYNVVCGLSTITYRLEGGEGGGGKRCSQTVVNTKLKSVTKGGGSLKRGVGITYLFFTVTVVEHLSGE